MGPRTVACVRSTVSTIFFVDVSMISWSWPSTGSGCSAPWGPPLLDDLGDAAGADGAAAFADGEPETFVHGDGLAQLHRHGHVVARHHHLGPLRQLDRPRHIRRPEEELRP